MLKGKGRKSPCSCIRNALMLTAVATTSLKIVIFNHLMLVLMPIVVIAQTLLWTWVYGIYHQGDCRISALAAKMVWCHCVNQGWIQDLKYVGGCPKCARKHVKALFSVPHSLSQCNHGNTLMCGLKTHGCTVITEVCMTH